MHNNFGHPVKLNLLHVVFCGVLTKLCLVMAVVIIILIRYKYSHGQQGVGHAASSGGGDTRGETRDMSRQDTPATFVPVCRQNKPDIISPTSRGEC